MWAAAFGTGWSLFHRGPNKCVCVCVYVCVCVWCVCVCVCVVCLWCVCVCLCVCVVCVYVCVVCVWISLNRIQVKSSSEVNVNILPILLNRVICGFLHCTRCLFIANCPTPLLPNAAHHKANTKWSYIFFLLFCPYLKLLPIYAIDLNMANVLYRLFILCVIRHAG